MLSHLTAEEKFFKAAKRSLLAFWSAWATSTAMSFGLCALDMVVQHSSTRGRRNILDLVGTSIDASKLQRTHGVSRAIFPVVLEP